VPGNNERRLGRRRDDQLVDDLEDLVDEVKRYKERIEPAIKLYESLVPYGIDRYMPLILDWFSRQQLMNSNGKLKKGLWDQRWVRWAAVIGIALAVTQLGSFLFNIYFIIRGTK
jgi:hypothetical protein